LIELRAETADRQAIVLVSVSVREAFHFYPTKPGWEFGQRLFGPDRLRQCMEMVEPTLASAYRDRIGLDNSLQFVSTQLLT